MSSTPAGLSARGLTRSDMDLADPDAVRRVLEAECPDWLINCAAYTAVDKAECEPEMARAINADAVAVMAECLRDSSGRLLQVSTDCVFDGSGLRAYRPEDQRDPISVYGETKAAGEDAAGPEAAVLRVSWVYASGYDNFVARMLTLMRERDRLQVVDDQIGSPSWAPDVARTIWALVAQGAKGIFHHCDGGQTSRYGWAMAIAEEAVKLGLLESVPEIEPVPSNAFPTPARRPLNSCLDTRSTRELLSDTAAPWRENLHRMLAEEAQHG